MLTVSSQLRRPGGALGSQLCPLPKETYAKGAMLTGQSTAAGLPTCSGSCQEGPHATQPRAGHFRQCRLWGKLANDPLPDGFGKTISVLGPNLCWGRGGQAAVLSSRG